MERKLSILKSKVDEIITICQNTAGRSKARTDDEAETMAEGLDQFLKELMPHNAEVIGQLELALAELHDNEIYDLVYLYVLGREWAVNPDEEKNFEYRQIAQYETEAFRNRGRNAAIDYFTGGLLHISQYLRYAKNIM